MNEDSLELIDYRGRRIRLTRERHDHILQHPEMTSQLPRITETLEQPEIVVSTIADDTVHVYHRLYQQTPVTRKYLLIAEKTLDDDAFILTAFFSN